MLIELNEKYPDFANLLYFQFFSEIIYISFTDIGMVIWMDITDELFQSFYREEKIIDTDISWDKHGDAYITNTVQIMNQQISDYDVNFVCKIDKYEVLAFVIYYSKNRQFLVKYDTKRHPPNQKDKHTKNKMDDPHKHKFKEGCRKNLTAKIIPNTEIDRYDINKAFFDFLIECNIRMEGKYSSLILSGMSHIQTSIYNYNKSIFDHIRGDKK